MKSIDRKPRSFPRPLAFACFVLHGGVCYASAQSAPDPVFEKPLPVTLAEWGKTPFHGVRAAEVNDYAPALFKGSLEPCPPHADHNPRKAVIVGWEKAAHRLVFSHEASYSERHVYYTLTGVAKDLTAIRRLAKQWLDKRPACARPESIADLSGLLGQE